MEKRQANLSKLVIEAQESKHLANRLMNLRGGVDQSPPRAFPHIDNRSKYKNLQKREINIQNAKMLKKIMEIMNRKPKENGLQGLPLKPLQNFENSMLGMTETFDNSFRGQNNITVI